MRLGVILHILLSDLLHTKWLIDVNELMITKYPKISWLIILLRQNPSQLFPVTSGSVPEKWCIHCMFLFFDIDARVFAVSQAPLPRREERRRRTTSFCFLIYRGQAERGERCPNRLVPHMLEINDWFMALPVCTSHLENYWLSWCSLIKQGFPMYLLHSSVSDCSMLP